MSRSCSYYGWIDWSSVRLFRGFHFSYNRFLRIDIQVRPILRRTLEYDAQLACIGGFVIPSRSWVMNSWRGGNGCFRWLQLHVEYQIIWYDPRSTSCILFGFCPRHSLTRPIVMLHCFIWIFEGRKIEHAFQYIRPSEAKTLEGNTMKMLSGPLQTVKTWNHCITWRNFFLVDVLSFARHRLVLMAKSRHWWSSKPQCWAIKAGLARTYRSRTRVKWQLQSKRFKYPTTNWSTEVTNYDHQTYPLVEKQFSLFLYSCLLYIL